MTRHVAVFQPLFEGLSRLASFLASKPKHMTFLMFAALIGGVTASLFGLHDVRGVLADTKWPFALGGVLVTIVAFAVSLVFYKWLLSRRDPREATPLHRMRCEMNEA